MSRISSILSSSDAVEKKRATEGTTPLGSDVALFARFFNGDDGAFMELFDRHTHRLFIYSLKYVGDRQQAEDVVQDLWERLIRLRRERREPPENPVGYILRMARNLSLNKVRDRRTHGSIDDLAEGDHPRSEERAGLSYHEELVVAALPHLPENQREVLVLNAYSGYRFDEIAEMLGEPVGAIRTRAWRARNGLARVISALIGLDDQKSGERNTRDDTARATENDI